MKAQREKELTRDLRLWGEAYFDEEQAERGKKGKTPGDIV